MFLGIPREPAAGGYARSPGDARRARYTVETRAILDAVGAGDAESVDFARRNFSLVFGDESRDDLECLKIVEVVREAGRVSFAGPFIPPSLRVGASAFLADGVRRILTAASARQRELAAGDPGVRIEMHLFVGAKAAWDQIGGDAPQFPEFPPAPASMS